MSYDELNIKKAESLSLINQQIEKGNILFKKGCLLIKGKSKYDISSRDRDLFESTFKQWVDITYSALLKVYKSSKYALEFKEKHSSKREYVNSSWIPDIEYYLRKQFVQKLDYLKMLRDSIDDFKERDDMTPIAQAWNALRTALQDSFNFYEIKEIVGLAGLDLTRIAHLEQKAGGGASKGQLMTGIDRVFGEVDEEGRRHFLAIVAEEVLKRRPETRDSLLDYLSRLGWTLVENALIPIELFDPSELAELPPESRGDLVKAAKRLRDGDLSGAISSACGSVDSATASVYAAEGLGNPATASFQERCKKALAARGVLPKIEKELSELGWATSDIMPFCKNFEGALNQGAYVMQTLRSKMGDLHGTKPILKPLVFDSVKWAQLLVRVLTDN
jgi:hypothetical protein